MLNSGEILSHYKIVSAIGAGGMGEVYLAEDTKLGRQVALKVLLGEVSGDKDRVSRFIQEAKAASALNHPNILTVYEIGNFQGSQYIATELILGETLRERIKREPLGLLDALDIAVQVTAALGAAHNAGIIHRDVKPENIMIRSDGLVKVLDFGLAKLLPSSSASVETTLPHFNTKPGMLVGTVAYMSPEQARGRTIDPRSDIFSFGIVMFEIFCGKRPFAGENHLDLISSILKDEPPFLRQISPDLPRELERIVAKSLRKDRDHRYQHIKDLNIDVEDLRDEIKFEAKLTNSVHPAAKSEAHVTQQSNLRSTLTTSISKTRRFTLLHALLFLTVAAVAAGTLWFLRPPGNTVAVAGTYKTREVATWNSAPGELSTAASFSPDGKLIAFASTRSGTKSIWVTQTASTDAIQITNDSFSNTDPIWSPKGDEIAFVSQRASADGVSSTGIWRVGALGGTPRSIGPMADGSSTLRRWTESGKIYYELRGELYANDISSGSSQKITSLGGTAKWVDISPDERTIAYAVENAGQWSILSSDLTGAKTIEIAGGVGKIDKEIAWLPAKKRVFFAATVDGLPQVFLTVVASGRNERIATLDSESSVVDASPDGGSIILSSAKEESNLWQVSVTGGSESPVARDLNAKLWPAVSRDNERVAFQSIKNLSAGDKIWFGNIVVKTLKTNSESDRPTLLSESGFLPSWSPDLSTVAFLKHVSGETELSVVNSNGGSEKRIASLGKRGEGYSISPYNLVQTQVFAWSPDGLKIAYIADKNGVSNIWTVTPRDGIETQVTSNTDSGIVFNCPIWASDGKRLAYYYQRRGRDANGKTVRGLRVVNTETGNTSDVLETVRIIRLIGWTPDENSLIIAEANKDNSGLPPETRLVRVAATGGAENGIANLKNIYFYNIFLSEDRKQIAYAARDQNMDNIWVISSGGGGPRKLTSNNDSGQYFSRLAWLSNGSAIVFGKQTRFSLLSITTDIN